MHLKRQKAPKKWPITRKGTTFVVRPVANLNNGIPILVVVRDMLNLAQNRKEVKRAINFRNLLLNSRPVNDEKESVLLFDVITIVPDKKNYRLVLLENGKFALNEVSESEAGKKVAKVINKKMLKGKKTQLNLSDGINFISDIKCNVHDSVSINLKNKKIEKCLPLKEGAKIVVFEGKHSGKSGVVNRIDEKHKMVEANFGEHTSNVLIKQAIVTE